MGEVGRCQFMFAYYIRCTAITATVQFPRSALRTQGAANAKQPRCTDVSVGLPYPGLYSFAYHFRYSCFRLHVGIFLRSARRFMITSTHSAFFFPSPEMWPSGLFLEIFVFPPPSLLTLPPALSLSTTRLSRPPPPPESRSAPPHFPRK